ncbi:MAG: hypothetical protein ACLR06_12880 [Christensenellaceae bacterium]
MARSSRATIKPEEFYVDKLDFEISCYTSDLDDVYKIDLKIRDGELTIFFEKGNPQQHSNIEALRLRNPAF